MKDIGIRTLQIAAAAALMGTAGCSPDPVIGKWEASQGQAKVVLDFKADGNGSHELTGMEAELQRRLGGRPLPPAAKAALEANRSKPFKWKKDGAAYKLEGASFTQGPGTGKVSGNQLTLAMGAQSMTFTRTAK